MIISSFSAAYLIIRKEIRHCKSLDSALRLIFAVKNKAMFYSSPFAEIIIKLQKNDDFDKLNIFDIFSENLASGLVVPEAWSSSVHRSNFVLEESELDVLIQFGKEMCSCSRAAITEISDNAISELQELKRNAIEKRNTKSKSTAAVTVSAGLMLVLIFL